MLKIRLQRVGRKNDPSFRVVVLESTQGPKAGKHIDQVGFYNAVTKQKTLDTEKAKYWISKGAQPSDTVYNMLVASGALAGKKRNVLPKKSPIKKEVTEDVAAQTQAPTSAEATAPAAQEPAAEVVSPEQTPAEEPKEAAPTEATEPATASEEPKAE